AFRLLTGYAESEVLGQSTHFLNGTHTDRTAVEKIELALQDSRACRVTIRHYRKNGTPFWNEVTLSPVKNRAGTVIQFIWVMNDVTQRQQDEEALKHTHDPAHLLAERMTEAILVIGEDNRIVYINAAGIRLLGATSPEQLIGNPLAAILPPDRQEAARQRLQHLRGSGDPRTSYEERFVCLDSHTLHKVITVMVSASPVLWKGRAATLLSCTDLTAERQARSTTLRLEQQLTSAETAAHLGSWEWNPGDDTAHWSKELYRILGHPQDTVAPSHDLFLSSFHPEDRDRLSMALTQYLESGTPLDVSSRIVQPNGTVRHVHCLGEAIVRNATNQPIRVTGTLQDLTPHVM
ncbi:MAG: PAS domain-containing protein, partial [Nitrospirota bacterium]